MERSCKNCVHYTQHYIIDSTRIAGVDCWHCKKVKRYNKKLILCARWEYKEENQEKIQQSISFKLEEISNEIKQLLLIFNKEPF